ncbi:hypothetical protein K502DRAFT_184434 [Neoconidiobolus thromboides FSU 785]|nr:hypothetical protein K502DRAFT_184434 [Neoconidiobolus thromboides FSU 785]
MKDFCRVGKKVIAIGRNFVDHAKELNNAVPKAPFFFLKPTSSYVQAPNSIELPNGCDCHYEIELGVVIGKEGRDIEPEKAFDYVSGYTLAIDMTARNMQNDVKKKGLPWSAAKGFDTFTPVGSFIEKDKVQDPHNLKLWLKVNDIVKQNGNTSDMMFKIPQLISHVSQIMRLEEGDLILTGTPKGVGPVIAGETITAGLEEGEKSLSSIVFPVVTRSGEFKYVSP